MCFTLPGRIKSIKKGIAIVENGAQKATVDLGLVSDAKVGDWVLYTSDRAVKRISKAEAEELKKIFDAK
jgi:hydrogenase assembly chaperone HypC/HupF